MTVTTKRQVVLSKAVREGKCARPGRSRRSTEVGDGSDGTPGWEPTEAGQAAVLRALEAGRLARPSTAVEEAFPRNEIMKVRVQKRRCKR